MLWRCGHHGGGGGLTSLFHCVINSLDGAPDGTNSSASGARPPPPSQSHCHPSSGHCRDSSALSLDLSASSFLSLSLSVSHALSSLPSLPSYHRPPSTSLPLPWTLFVPAVHNPILTDFLSPVLILRFFDVVSAPSSTQHSRSHDCPPPPGPLHIARSLMSYRVCYVYGCMCICMCMCLCLCLCMCMCMCMCV